MIWLFRLIARMWRAHQRMTDLEILWPSIRAQAPYVEAARAAFAVHAFQDEAWTQDFSQDQIVRIIEGLE